MNEQDLEPFFDRFLSAERAEDYILALKQLAKIYADGVQEPNTEEDLPSFSPANAAIEKAINFRLECSLEREPAAFQEEMDALVQALKTLSTKENWPFMAMVLNALVKQEGDLQPTAEHNRSALQNTQRAVTQIMASIGSYAPSPESLGTNGPEGLDGGPA